MDRDKFLDALLTLPRMYNPLVSPDGAWAAWTVYGAGVAADVYAAPTDGSQAPLRLTDTPEMTVALSWASDSRSLVVQQDHGGDERAQLLRVYLDRPGEMEPLTEEWPGFFVRGGRLHPNGRWLVYGANYDFERGAEIEPTWVYRHDLLTGERVPIARPHKPLWYQPHLNEQGTHVLYNRKERHPSGEQVWLADIEGREDREVLNCGDDMKTYASWLPDGVRAIVHAQAGTHNRVGVWDRETGDLRWLVDDPARNIEAAYAPRRGDRAVVLEVKDARLRATLLDADTGEETALPDVPGDLIPIAPVADGEWVGQHYSSRQPANLVRFSLDDTDPAPFASLNRIWEQTPLRADDLTQAESFRWPSADGMEIQGWLYRPRGEAKGTIVYVHGGPTSHSPDALNPQIQFYVSEGFNVLDPNYRGSTGFSLAFREAIKEDGWGGREQVDIRTGIEALIREGIARPGKVGITGTSYGGYSSWWAITHFPTDVLAAAAPVCGMTDLTVDYETTRPDLRPYSEEMMGGTPEQVPQRYHERSPINHLHEIRGKLLIVQGMQDPNVTPTNVSVVRAALDKLGVQYDVLAFEDEGHGILRTENRRVLYPRIAEFVKGAME
ncbi:MAG TPA: prolyl oligopeptidase family serine peptidase [Chloroflexia bacterium]|jgi:dienelactone hydrolase